MFLVFTVVVSWVEYRRSVLSIDPVTLFDLIHESVLEARRLPLVLDTLARLLTRARTAAGAGSSSLLREVRFHEHDLHVGVSGSLDVTGLALRSRRPRRSARHAPHHHTTHERVDR